MTKEELDRMSLPEIQTYGQKLSAELTKLNHEIRERKKYLRAVRYPGYEPNVKNDPEILRTKARVIELQRETANLKEYKRRRNAIADAERERAELERAKIRMERAQFEAENKDFIDERNSKADERRPSGPAVWMGQEFKNIKGAEKRLIIMMAREIGQMRYTELRRIAFWDHERGNNRYYTGNDNWNDRKGLF